MGVAIQCVLESPVPGCPHLEGKSLAVAYCGDATVAGHDANVGNVEENVDGGQIIAVDFGGKRPPGSPAGSTWSEPLLAALDPFLAGEDGGSDWHDPTEGLVAVRTILEKLRSSASIEIDMDFDSGDGDSDDLISGIGYDLETLESILAAAQSAGIRFRLTFDV